MHGMSSALKGHNMKAWGNAPGKLPSSEILNPGRCPGLSYPALSGLNANEETQRLESIDQRKLTALDDLKTSLLHQAFSGGTEMHGMSFALKGHNMKAWGNAPGKRSPQSHPALKGRHNTTCSAPSGLPGSKILTPRRCPGLSYPALSGLNAKRNIPNPSTSENSPRSTI